MQIYLLSFRPKQNASAPSNEASPSGVLDRNALDALPASSTYPSQANPAECPKANSQGPLFRLPATPPRHAAIVGKPLCMVVLLLLLTVYSTATSAQGIDRIRRRGGGTESGKITNISPLTVTLSKGGVENKVLAEEIRTIDFGNEPEDLRPARLAANAGRFEDALKHLNKIARDDIDREAILQDLDYWKLFCNSQLALAGQESLSQASEEASSFLSSNRSSYHVPAAIQLKGNLLTALGQHEAARKHYAKLEKANSPYYTARAAILTGMSWQQQDNHQAAIKEFDRALEATQKNQTAQTQSLEATLQMAISRSATGNVTKATDSVKEIIDATDSKDSKLLARAYNALGDCYLQIEQAKAARDAFLHVDVLFNSEKTEHAKALYELSQLWNQLGQEDRARDARQQLQKKYPTSRWAQKNDVSPVGN